MTNANTSLGQKKARPASSLVGHHLQKNSSREVGDLLRLLINEILPQFTLSPRRMPRLHVLAAF